MAALGPPGGVVVRRAHRPVLRAERPPRLHHRAGLRHLPTSVRHAVFLDHFGGASGPAVAGAAGHRAARAQEAAPRAVHARVPTITRRRARLLQHRQLDIHTE